MKLEAIAKSKATPQPPNLDIDPATVAPGTKIQLNLGDKIKNTQALIAKLQKKIREMERMIAQSQAIKDSTHAKKVSGLKDNLVGLEKHLQAELAKLLAKQDALQAEQKQITPGVTALFALLDQRCKNYLDVVRKTKKWLYRGTTGADEYIAASWNTREVKDSDPDAQVVFDKLLTRMGFTALRSNSIFATSDIDHASGFGEGVWAIFPIDGHSTFTYTKFRDITLSSLEEVGLDDTKAKKFTKQIHAFLKSSQPGLPEHDRLVIMTNPQYGYSMEAVLSAVEDHVAQGNEYKLPDSIVGVTMADFVSPSKFKKIYGPQNTNLARALKEELEVCVSGGYYALRAKKYGAWLAQHYGVPIAGGWYS